MSSKDEPVFRLNCLEVTQIRTCYGYRDAIRNDVHVSIIGHPPPRDNIVTYKEQKYNKDPNAQEM